MNITQKAVSVLDYNCYLKPKTNIKYFMFVQ